MQCLYFWTSLNILAATNNSAITHHAYFITQVPASQCNATVKTVLQYRRTLTDHVLQSTSSSTFFTVNFNVYSEVCRYPKKNHFYPILGSTALNCGVRSSDGVATCGICLQRRGKICGWITGALCRIFLCRAWVLIKNDKCVLWLFSQVNCTCKCPIYRVIEQDSCDGMCRQLQAMKFPCWGTR
jgi:hypothetical protein